MLCDGLRELGKKRKRESMSDKYYVYRPMINLIGKSEGTAPPKGRGYNETLGYGAYTGGDVNLVAMSLDQIDALQTKMLRHPKNKLRSSALGWSQIIRTTLRDIRAKLPSRYPGTRKFDEACQDELTCYLLGVRGIDKYLAGRLSEDTLINNLAQEWASFPTTSGKGHYAGQQGKTTVADVRRVLKEVKARHFTEQPKEVIVPKEVEQEVKQKTNWLTTIFGVGGVGSAVTTWLSGADAQTITIVIGAFVIICIVMLIGGTWIVRRVRAIRQELES